MKSLQQLFGARRKGAITGAIALLTLSAASIPAAYAVHTPGVDIETEVLFVTNSTWAGDPVKYMKTGTPEVRAQTVEFAPGAATTWHYHPVPSYIYVIEGTFQVETGDGRLQQFNAGQAFVEVVNTLHRGTNVGAVPAKLVVFYTGDGSPVTVLTLPTGKDKDKDKDMDKKDKDD